MIGRTEQVDQKTNTLRFNLQDFLDILPEAAFVVNGEGKVKSWNSGAENLLENFMMADGSIEFPYLVEAGETREIEFPRSDSSLKTLRIRVSETNLNGGATYLVLLEDISEEKQQDKGEEIIQSLAELLHNVSSYSYVLNLLFDKLSDLVPFASLLVLRKSKCGDEYHVEMAKNVNQERLNGMSFPDGAIDQFLKGSKPYLINDLSIEKSLDWHTIFPEARTAGIFPILCDDTHDRAVIILSSQSIPEFQGNIIGRMVDLVARELHRTTLNEQAQQGMHRLNALRILNLAVSGSLDLEKTLNVLLDQITNQLNVDAADIYLLNSNTRLLEHTARSGFWSNYSNNSYLKIGEGLPGKVVQEQKHVQILNVGEQKHRFERIKMLEREHFVTYYAVPLISKGRIKGVLELFSRRLVHLDQHWENFLDALAAEAAVAITNAEMVSQLQGSNEELRLAYDATILGWSRTLELRDHETKGHCDRVVDLTIQLAIRMGLPDSELVHMRRGAMLHDIGKTGIPDSILLKTGPLSIEERDVMRKHPEYAMQLLSGIPFLQPALDIPCYHHERWDGRGYPRGLEGENIPLAARIFSIVDVYDALSNERPYRAAWSHDEVMKYIAAGSGAAFDPRVVEAFLGLIAEMDAKAKCQETLILPRDKEECEWKKS